jgi:thimet oligopeptidase
LTTDYPTYLGVMDDCSVEETHKQLTRAFENRAYPINEGVLKTVIAKRDELARELGFASYADLDLDNQMAKKTDVAEKFLNELLKRSAPKELQEFKQLTAQLPESVTLTADGKMKSWDRAYLRARYKKQHFNLDERVVAEYFPMEETLKRLFGIYEEFMGLKFTIKSASHLWHEDVQVIEAYDAATQKLLGYLLIDLHPRPNKYTHACHGNIVPAVTLADGSQPYVVSLVIANFPKSTPTKPALLKRDDVSTFFHEFGHALHGLLGRTKTASFSGTRVKTDFVEMPSQMLEEWMWEKDVLKRVSSHYVSGESLSDELIANILASKHFDTGTFLQRQAYLSFISLNYYKAGADKDVSAIMRDLFIRTRPHVAYDDQGHMFASFGHLTNYGAKYYGYMWSKVFALDMFDVIKKHGLNREIGRKYVEEVIGKGGSQDPKELLVAFLGREPQQDAFFKDMGL